MKSGPGQPGDSWREHLHTIIFEADTAAGKRFDTALLVAIIASILAVMLDSMQEVASRYGDLLDGVEWVLTLAFTVEYILRLACVKQPLRYAFSFFGIVDLLSIIPTWASLFLPGSESMLVIRSLRLLRVFRVFKLGRFVDEATLLRQSLSAARAKLAVFVTTVIIAVVILGTAMYVVEGPEHGFTSVPVGMYWAVVTLTTVGYGDLTPQTPFGQLLSVTMMILGYSLIIVPTGILSVELAQASSRQVSTRHCTECSEEGHDHDAQHCKFCGAEL